MLANRPPLDDASYDDKRGSFPRAANCFEKTIFAALSAFLAIDLCPCFRGAVVDTAAGARLPGPVKPDQQKWREAREGAYMLRTNFGAGLLPEL